jgi:hypothetical protein
MPGFPLEEHREPVPTLFAVAETKRTSGTKRLPAWLIFTLLRVLAFVVPLLIMLALGASLLAAAVIAAVVGLCVSVIFLSRQRGAVVHELTSRRRPEAASPPAGGDESVEDAAVDRAAGQSGSASAAARPKP